MGKKPTMLVTAEIYRRRSCLTDQPWEEPHWQVLEQTMQNVQDIYQRVIKNAYIMAPDGPWIGM